MQKKKLFIIMGLVLDMALVGCTKQSGGSPNSSTIEFAEVDELVQSVRYPIWICTETEPNLGIQLFDDGTGFAYQLSTDGSVVALTEFTYRYMPESMWIEFMVADEDFSVVRYLETEEDEGSYLDLRMKDGTQRRFFPAEYALPNQPSSQELAMSLPKVGENEAASGQVAQTSDGRYVYQVGDVTLESSINVWDYIDSNNNFDFAGMLEDWGFERILRREFRDGTVGMTYAADSFSRNIGIGLDRSEGVKENEYGLTSCSQIWLNGGFRIIITEADAAEAMYRIDNDPYAGASFDQIVILACCAEFGSKENGDYERFTRSLNPHNALYYIP